MWMADDGCDIRSAYGEDSVEFQNSIPEDCDHCLGNTDIKIDCGESDSDTTFGIIDTAESTSEPTSEPTSSLPQEEDTAASSTEPTSEPASSSPPEPPEAEDTEASSTEPTSEPTSSLPQEEETLFEEDVEFCN